MASSSNQSCDIIDTASITWNIGNFSNTNNFIWSPGFYPVNQNKSAQFQVMIYPNSTVQFCTDDVLVYLWHSRSEKILNLEYDVSILKSDGEKGFTKKFYWNYNEDYDLNRNVTYLISTSELKKSDFLQNNQLTFRCEVIMHASPVSPNKHVITMTIKDKVLLQNYQTLLESGKHSDVILQIGKKEIHAHKTILAAQSPVFSAMFEHRDTKEAQEGRVEIIDIGSDAFEELLRYIYSGTMPDLDKYAQELFVAADKYQLDHLKSICEDCLGNSLSVESVASVLQLADLHQADGLKAKCVTFITANCAEVLVSEGWKKLRKCRLELVSEMLENIIISVTSKK